MIRSFGAAISRWSTRWVPDPFVIAILLTLVTLILAVVVTAVPVHHAVGHWGGRLKDGALIGTETGLWKFLRFGMQMCLILVSGHALASAPAVRRAIASIADRPANAVQAVALTAVVAMVAGLVNWGLGLIVGALLARDVGRSAERRGISVHYPLLGAAGYAALLVWHGGLSGSAPLKLTQAQDISGLMGALKVDPIPLTETLFSPMNLTWMVAMLVVVPLILVRMLPRAPGEVRSISEFVPEQDLLATPAGPDKPTPAQRLEYSRSLAWGLAALALWYAALFIGKVGVDRIGINSINLVFIALGLILHGSPKAYGDAVANGTRSCSGIILQFPFYAGIMGIMSLSGLVELIANGMVAVASESTHGPLTFLSAGVVNLFVPSGGGQWGIQGGIVIETAQQMGLDTGKAVMAFCYGDQWTNMLQPFWALPLLGITGLKAGDLIGYTAALMLLTLPVFLVVLGVF